MYSLHLLTIIANIVFSTEIDIIAVFRFNVKKMKKNYSACYRIENNFFRKRWKTTSDVCVAGCVNFEPFLAPNSKILTLLVYIVVC